MHTNNKCNILWIVLGTLFSIFIYLLDEINMDFINLQKTNYQNVKFILILLNKKINVKWVF